MDRTLRQDIDLPGFRFHPTEEELLGYYLKKMALGKALHFNIIGTLDLYSYDPWELPRKAEMRAEREWYFFVPRDRKNQSGRKPNRIAKGGFWKATGTDRLIRSAADPRCIIGIKKTLVYYTGRAPRGGKTDWIMNEYRMPDNCQQCKRDIVLCKIYRKATSIKVLEQRALEGNSMEAIQGSHSTTETGSSSEQEFSPNVDPKPEIIEDDQRGNHEVSSQFGGLQFQEIASELVTGTVQIPVAMSRENLTKLQMPKANTDWWTQDSSMAYSPWMDNWNPDTILIDHHMISHFSPTLLHDPQLVRDLEQKNAHLGN
ncbi:NAC domain-containing protein 6 [Nymphaea colorata]|nr:NAC domain-containing protein 6 [Nymphaea colorata]